MAEFKATISQHEAISTRGSAVLVSAGAGSGKTKVLTERLMGYICDGQNPADVDSFLIITYTRAAAAELRGRIMEELAKRLAAEPGNKRLRRQNALIQRAQIGTIHSFCAQLLRENCQMLSLSPDFKIAEEERAEAMRISAIERVLEKRYDELEERPYFRALADTVGEGRDDRKLQELVLSLHSRMQSHPRPGKWAAEQVKMLRGEAYDIAQTPWGAEILDHVQQQAEYWAEEFDRLMELIASVPEIHAAYMDNFANSAEQIRELRRAAKIGWDKARDCLPIEFKRLNGVKKNPDPALTDRLKARRDACKDSMKKIAELMAADSDTLLGELKATAPVMEELLALTLDFDKAYAKDKRNRAMLDYSDLEHMAVELLCDEEGRATPLARQLSRRYIEIMVDEYQDVSRVQESIFSAISREGRNLFMVGDVKQSIYRFRLADPEIFTEKYLSFQDFEAAAPGEPRRILLRENFRSRKEILEGANAVFSLCMSRNLGDIDYDEKAALVCGADWYEGEGHKPELMLLELPPASDGESPDKTRLEAEFVAGKIRELIDSGATVTVPGGERPMEYGDICILLRSANAVGGVYRQALSEKGIPAGGAQSGEFFQSVEVSTVMSMLSVMDNPHKDIALIAVLRSPAIGFTPDELSMIRSADKNIDFYSALQLAAETDEKCRDFIERLSALRSAAADMSAAETVWQIIEEFDLLAICSAMDEGARRRANLMELTELAESFESGEYRGLHRFVLWLQALRDKGQEISAGGSFDSAVQIMTIHKSKGLEFPVVFLSDTAKKFNARDRQETVLVHPVLGLGPKLVDLKRKVKYPTLARSAISRRIAREDLSEEMRLLYVALTRAKERMYITAALKKPYDFIEKAEAAVSVPMAEETLSKAGNMMTWLVYSCIADGGKHLEMKVFPIEGDSGSAADGGDSARADEAALIELERRLSFRYPHGAAQDMPSKLTATELKGRENEDDEGDGESLVKSLNFSFTMPDLGGEDRPLRATERGVATHLVLQYMDFEKGRNRSGIKDEIQRLEAAGFISPREAKAVNVSAIERLFASDMGRRMLRAKEALREFRFSILMDAGDIQPEAAGEKLLLQGVVDCCIDEGDGLVIIDYKTDAVRTAEEIASRAEHYRPQLMAYAKALGRILKKPVKECLLFFLSTGEEYRIS